MKIAKLLCGVVLVGFASFALAATDNMKDNAKNKWICSTNASSSSNEADQKADEEMKKAMKGKEAFAFAMKHCRDCTKITCSME